MNESVIPVTPGLLTLLGQGDGGITPFRQEIFILEIVVAGTSYCKEIGLVDESIVPGKVLTMKREPSNRYDEFAIAVYCDQTHIGFVPRKMNLVCSRLMDAGKLFFCRVVEKEWKEQWLKITANIYMVE
ncbi:MAG TPA: HIRAN domain-containing protein [Bacteroidales bacterium]|nr:HIRAN domain-containing protein [Bacteroidales bacterium]HRZ47776.1 HIRAN domain-containing protein [Bacteroidales bacterium]